jgi:hypothetical protein
VTTREECHWSHAFKGFKRDHPRGLPLVARKQGLQAERSGVRTMKNGTLACKFLSKSEDRAGGLVGALAGVAPFSSALSRNGCRLFGVATFTCSVARQDSWW